MKNKIYKKVYGIDEDNFIDYHSHLSFSKKWILENCGWHIYWHFCYCPACFGPRKLRFKIKNWKYYRKQQYKAQKDHKLNL